MCERRKVDELEAQIRKTMTGLDREQRETGREWAGGGERLRMNERVKVRKIEMTNFGCVDLGH